MESTSSPYQDQPAPQPQSRYPRVRADGPKRRCLDRTYRDEYKALVDIAYRLLGCRAWAEDVVQDAFVRLLENDRGETARNLAGYTRRAVRNLAIDRLRRQALEHRHLSRSDLAEDVGGTVTPESTAAGEEAVAAMSGALDALPKRTQRVFTLTLLEGHTQRETARLIGVSPASVNFALRDALSQCRASINASG